MTPRKVKEFFKEQRKKSKRSLVHGTIKFKDKDGKTQFRSVPFVPTLDDYADDLIDDLESLADEYAIDVYTVVLSVTFAR